MSSPRLPLTPGATFGKYRLRRLIGSGGMGRVFEALDTTKGRVVALKVLPEQLADDPVYRARFRRESHIAAVLQEPHVIPIHDYGEIDGLLYIDMRLVRGESLGTVLRTAGPLPPEQAIAVIGQIAAALDAAHHEGLIHRDVKPDNILLTHDGFAYLVDFGLANTNTDERLTQTGSAIGSFNYMAPERFQSGPTTATVDVYALACVLHECLTGTRPYPNDGSDAAVMHAHLFEPPPRPSTRAPGVPVAIDAVVARGMAKSADQRYTGAGELAAAARAALASSPSDAEDGSATVTVDGEPTVTARSTPVATSTPEARAVPAGRRRPRRLWIAAAAAAVAVLAAAAVGAWPLLHKSASPTTGPAKAEFTDDDVTLLKILPAAYSRNTCHHQNPGTYGDKAHLACDGIAEISSASGDFHLFPNADALHLTYRLVSRDLHASSCPGDPPGPDGPATKAGREVGRMACFTRATTTPPTPALIQTNEAAFVIAVFFFDESAGGSAALAYQVRDKGDGNSLFKTTPADPDFYTPADRALLAKLPAAYNPRYCRHVEPPSNNVTAAAFCFGNESGVPFAAFSQSPDHAAASRVFDFFRILLDGHACGDATVPDQSWIRKGTTVGRFACATDRSTGQPFPSLLAVDQSADTVIGFLSDRPDSPYNRPKSEQELVDWFKRNFQ
ncbi:serine/threonine-protein kinase [Nocardia sp. NPDC004123]